MEITPTTFLLVGIICVVLGFAASALLNTLRDEEVSPPQDEVSAPPGGRKGRYTAVARLWRDDSTRELVVEINGKSALGPSGLEEREVEQLEQAARDLRGWLGMGLAESTPASPARPQAVTAPAASPAKPYTAGAPVTTQTGIVSPAAEAAVPAARSIAMQIEDILQDQISGTPLGTRGIHVHEDPVRGVIVTVGMERFEGIDSVADPEVKAALRHAVATWEARQ